MITLKMSTIGQEMRVVLLNFPHASTKGAPQIEENTASRLAYERFKGC